jgi:hypothetical protein
MLSSKICWVQSQVNLHMLRKKIINPNWNKNDAQIINANWNLKMHKWIPNNSHKHKTYHDSNLGKVIIFLIIYFVNHSNCGKAIIFLFIIYFINDSNLGEAINFLFIIYFVNDVNDYIEMEFFFENFKMLPKLGHIICLKCLKHCTCIKTWFFKHAT